MNIQVNSAIEKVRNSHPEIFREKAAMKILVTFTGKYPWWSPIWVTLPAEVYSMPTKDTHSSDSFMANTGLLTRWKFRCLMEMHMLKKCLSIYLSIDLSIYEGLEKNLEFRLNSRYRKDYYVFWLFLINF